MGHSMGGTRHTQHQHPGPPAPAVAVALASQAEGREAEAAAPRTKTFNAEALAKYRAAPVCGGMVAKPTLAWSLAMTTAVVGTRPSSATRGHPMPDLLLPPWTPTYNLSQSTMTQVTLHAV
jgi:hypothetical protein